MIKIAILNSLGFFFLSFLIPIVARIQMKASVFEIGLILSSLVIGYMISSFFIGIAIDRTGKKSFWIFIGSVGRGLSYLVIYFSIILNSLFGLWIGMFVLGFGAGFFWIPFDVLVSEKSKPEHRSQAFGKRDLASGIGQGIGAGIGFCILIIFGLFTSNPLLIYSAIILFGIANFIAGILFLFKVDESINFIDTSNSSNNQINLKLENTQTNLSTIMILGISILFFIVFLSSVNNNLGKPFINIYIIENITDILYIVVIIYVPGGIVATFLAPKLGELMDKINPFIGITITSLFGAILTWLLINTKNIFIFAIILVFDITIAVAAGLLFRNLLSRINIQHRGKILGLTSFFVNIGAIIGPILGGLAWDIYGPKAPFIISIYVELCLIPLYLIVVRLLMPHFAETYEIKTKKK